MADSFWVANAMPRTPSTLFGVVFGCEVSVWAVVGWYGGIDSIQAVVFCLHIFLSTHSTKAPLYPSVPQAFVWWGLSLSLCVHLCGWVSVRERKDREEETALQCIVGQLDLSILGSLNHNWPNDLWWPCLFSVSDASPDLLLKDFVKWLFYF